MRAPICCCAPRTSGADLAGLRLLVVDDVMTTGATLRAACTALQAAGAQHISVLAVARTP